MRIHTLSLPHRRTALAVQLIRCIENTQRALQVLALLLTFALCASQARAATTFTGTLGSNSVAYPGSSGAQTGRLDRNGVVSTCASPKPFPGLIAATGQRNYDAYEITNPSNTTPACVTVSYTYTGGGAGNGLFAVAYLNSFTPTNISQNYLADPGTGVTPAAAGPVTFSFTIPAGATAVLVVHEVDPATNVGATYSVTLSGLTAESFVVTSTADPGAGGCTAAGVGDGCTLREAITAANANLNPSFPDTISFNIAGGGVKTIIPLTALPNITEAVNIDGYTQPGAAAATATTPATILIEINGNALAEAGLNITGSNSIISGLAVNRFGLSGIAIPGPGGGNAVLGCYLGTDTTGTIDRGNGTYGCGVSISRGNFIGGVTPAGRNVISGNDNYGVLLLTSASTDNVVQGSYIGTDATGTVALGNTIGGILIGLAPNNAVGGTDAAQRNLISGNGGSGITIDTASGNSVLGNLIGTDSTGALALGNTGNGIFIVGAPNNVIGGTAAGSRNIISGNSGNGITIVNNTATGNSVQGNYIGTDITGNAPLGNTTSGVLLINAPNNLIGGTAAGAGNVQGNRIRK